MIYQAGEGLSSIGAAPGKAVQRRFRAARQVVGKDDPCVFLATLARCAVEDAAIVKQRAGGHPATATTAENMSTANIVARFGTFAVPPGFLGVFRVMLAVESKCHWNVAQGVAAKVKKEAVLF
jgi:hypothetical protein